MYEFFFNIENLPTVVAFSESLFAYPLVQGLHVLTLAVAVGLLALADLRLCNLLLTAYPARAVVGGLRPWFIGGYALMFLTGIVLFLPKASLLYASPLFWTKMALILLAGANAFYFELNYHKGSQTPGSIKPQLAGLASLGLWVAVIVTGRLLAYF
jgi:hypothetical protein